jgi:ribokinase
MAQLCDVVCVASWNADLVARVPRPIGRGETLHASSFEILPGGKGSNAAVACARQGARVALIARVGSDAFGRMALELWAREGIATRHVEVAEGEASGVAQILVYEDGDNSIAVAAGANAGLGAAHVDAAADTLASARVVVSSCEVALEATRAAFEHARKAGATTLLNPAPARPLPNALLALCDVLVANDAEVRVLAGEQALLAQGAKAVIVTSGALGCTLFRRGQAPYAVAGHGVKVVDTVGAGDTLVGALAAELARGAALEPALAWANAAAALSVTGRGALGGMPARDAVAALLNG